MKTQMTHQEKNALFAKLYRKQFDVIGLTKENGWTDEKITQYCKQPDWFNKHTWSKEQKAEWKRYAKQLGLDAHSLTFHDLNVGWRDAR